MTAGNTHKPQKPRRPLNAATLRQRPGPKRKLRAPALVPQRSRWTEKQRRFVSEYVIDLNATQAAVRAGYSERTAPQIGSENLRKPHIAAAIEEELAARAARTQVTSDEVVRELRRIGMARLDHAVSWDNERLVLVPSEQLSQDTAAAVASVDRGKYGPRIRMHDKVKALQLLGEHTGAFEAGQQQAQMIQVNIVVDDKREVGRPTLCGVNRRDLIGED